MNQVKYFYIRVDNDNTIEAKLAEHFGGHSDYEHHRGDPIACVAYRRESGGLVRWALSTVNQKHDRFSKSEARRIATERLETDASVVHCNDLQTRGSDVSYEVMKKLVELDFVPTQVKKAAKEWLFG